MPTSPGTVRRRVVGLLGAGADFDRASAFVQRRAEGTGSSARLPWFLDVAGAWALVRLVLSLPVLDVQLSGSGAGRGIGRQLGDRTFGVPRVRVCAAVLEVPTDVADRPSGKRYRSLRTALTAAAAAGMSLRPVHDAEERRAIARAVSREVPRLAGWAATAAHEPAADWWVAFDRGGRPVGVAVALIDARWASLLTLVGVPGSGLQSHARFALHHRLVQHLSERGVRHLAVLDDSALLAGPGARHVQRVLGYVPVRLRRPTVLVARQAAPGDPFDAVDDRTSLRSA